MAATHTIGEKFLISIGPFFITSLLTIGFIFRAFIAPIRLGANLNDLFPLRWILMGSLGLVNDLFKAPGYLLGASAMEEYLKEKFMILSESFS